MNVVAEEAQRRFRAEIETALLDVPANDPLQRFRQFGLANLCWAIRNLMHFEVVSSRRLFDQDQFAEVSRGNGELIDLAERTLADAFAGGQLRATDLKQVQIAARALVYGFARMNIDGHLPRWGVADGEAERTAIAIIDLFISPSASAWFRPGGTGGRIDAGTMAKPSAFSGRAVSRLRSRPGSPQHGQARSPATRTAAK